MNPPKNKIYQTESLKLKHEKDTAEEVTKAFRNTNFHKIQINSATDKEQQIKKLKILEKEHNQTLKTKMRENQEKYDENLKILFKVKKNCRT